MEGNVCGLVGDSLSTAEAPVPACESWLELSAGLIRSGTSCFPYHSVPTQNHYLPLCSELWLQLLPHHMETAGMYFRAPWQISALSHPAESWDSPAWASFPGDSEVCSNCDAVLEGEMCPCVWSAENCCSVSQGSAPLAAGSFSLNFTGNQYLEENSPAAPRESCWKSRMKACPGFLPVEVIKGHCVPGTTHSQQRHFGTKQDLPLSYCPDVWLPPQFSSIKNKIFFSRLLCLNKHDV